MITPPTGFGRLTIAALVAAAGVLTFSSISAPTAAGAAARVADGQSAFRPVTPCRIADTRASSPGADTLDPSTIRVQVTGRCGVTTGASAAAISIAVANTTTTGFAAVAPAGTPGATSTINWSAGEIRSASTVVKLSSSGAIDIAVSAGLANAAIIVDVSGQWDPASGPVAAGRIVTLAGRRVLDTRTTSSRLTAGQTLTLGRITLGLPAGATAITGTLTSTGSSGPGYLTSFAAGQAVPLASNVNTDGADQSRSAGVIIPVSDRGLSVFAGSATTDVVLDITGYVTGSGDPVSSNGLLIPVDPTRLLDTRTTANPTTTSVDVTLAAPIDGVAITGVVATLTSTSATGPGFAAIRAVGEVEAIGPLARQTSSLNWAGTPGAVASMTVQSVNEYRQLRVSASSPTALIFDVTAYLIADPFSLTSSPPVVGGDQPRSIATGMITDTTGVTTATGNPVDLLRQTYSANELRAGGGLNIVYGDVPNGSPAMVPYNAAAYPVCGAAPMCVMLAEARWKNPGRDPINSNRVMISHEFGHVIAMRYQTNLPASQLTAWNERYAMVNEECVADSIASIVLARGDHSPNATADYSVHYDCDAYWTVTHGADHLAEMRAMSIDVASEVLRWAEQWGAENPS